MTETVESFLVRIRDSEDRRLKGDDGMRTTREVADACGLTMPAARRKLTAAFEAGRIEAFDGGASGRSGNPIYWQAKTAFAGG